MNVSQMACVNARRSLGWKHRDVKTWAWRSFYLFILMLVTWCHWVSMSPMNDERPVRWPERTYAIAGVPAAHRVGDQNATRTLENAYALLDQGRYREATVLFRNHLDMHALTDVQQAEASLHGLGRGFLALHDLESAKAWTDKLYETTRSPRAEPAYYLCKALRETGRPALAYYYYLLAAQAPRLPAHGDLSPFISVEPAVYDYLLDSEKALLWPQVGGLDDRFTRLHGLALSMQLLARDDLPATLREAIFNNLEYCVLPLAGYAMVLRPEISVQEPWRFSTPTFLGNTTFIRVVNYYVADDGSYHVSPGRRQVNTRLMLQATGEFLKVVISKAFQHEASLHELIHKDSSILGLEDTRFVLDKANNDTVYTLSTSKEYSWNAEAMNQVLGILDLQAKVLEVQGVVRGPLDSGQSEKNWVFAGGLGNVVYDWYPTIRIGSISVQDMALDLHTAIPAPSSFYGMRGSTNGFLYKDEWWFVTHAVIHRWQRMRKYLHRIVVLSQDFSAVVRYSRPFTFEDPSDVEYCLGLKVEESGLTFGYSVRDRSSHALETTWEELDRLFSESAPYDF